MRVATIILLLALSSIAFAGGARENSPAVASAGAAALNPCRLLTAREIQRVQGERFTGTRQTEQRASGFRLLECFYSTPSAAKSVSLALSVSDLPKTSPSAGPRRFWKERFHSAADENQNRELRADGDKEESRPPLAVSGVGEEAYWMGNRLAGALYVLSGEYFLRISLGGGESEEVKRQKSVVLAKAALANIQR